MIKPHTCPVCQKQASQLTDSQWFPFCSERCRNVDLARWSDGKYAIVDDIADRPDLQQELLAEMEMQLEELDDQADEEGYCS